MFRIKPTGFLRYVLGRVAISFEEKKKHALPYKLVNETILMANRDLNYEYGVMFSHPTPPYEEFFEMYKKYEPDYPVYPLPYSCHREKALEVLYMHFYS